MATLAQLRSQIVLDANINGNPYFSVARLNRMINLAQRYVQTQLNGLGMKKWEASDSLTLSDGTILGTTVRQANLSTDCPNMLESPKSIMFIETYDDSLPAQYSYAYEVTPREFREQLGNYYLIPTKNKPIFMRLANYLYLYPSTLATATAYYYKTVTDLSSDSASTEIPLEFEEFIIKKVVLDIKEILGQIQEKVVEQGQLEKDLQMSYEKFLGKQIEAKRPEINHTVVQ